MKIIKFKNLYFILALIFLSTLFSYSLEQRVLVRIFSLHNLKEIKITGDVTSNNGSKFKKLKICASNHCLETTDLKTLKKTHADVLKLKISGHAEAENDSSGHKILSGTLIIKNSNDKLLIINEIPLENYIEGVVFSELKRCDLLELNKAQAVVSRSFALSHIGNHKKEGYDFCDSTCCQLYRGVNFSPEVSKAVNETTGEVLSYQEKTIPGFFHSTCGGKTCGTEEIFGSFTAGICGITDKIKGKNFLCEDSEHFKWKEAFSIEEISKIFPGISNFKDLKISSFGKSGRAKEIALTGDSLQKISAYNFWLRIGQNYGWGRIKNTYFKIYKNPRSAQNLFSEKVGNRKGNNFIFIGHGLGHGIGMCQAGAEKLAKLGYNYKFILKHYFPKTNLKRTK